MNWQEMASEVRLQHLLDQRRAPFHGVFRHVGHGVYDALETLGSGGPRERRTEYEMHLDFQRLCVILRLDSLDNSHDFVDHRDDRYTVLARWFLEVQIRSPERGSKAALGGINTTISKCPCASVRWISCHPVRMPSDLLGFFSSSA